MSINLVKGETINLSKEAAGAEKFELRAGWDTSFGTSMDIDISVGEVGQDGNGVDFVYFGKMKSNDGALKLSGDNRTGEGDGWDETIYLDSTKISENVKTIPAIVNIYAAKERGQNFGLVRNLKVQIYDVTNDKVVADFIPELEVGTSTAMLLGEFVVANGSMYFKPLGKGYDELRTILNEYKIS